MTLQKLAIFAAVARHRSLTKASEELAISEPSVSLHLKELQQHYRTQLFRRVSKGMELTAEGRAFLRRVDPILNQVAALEKGASLTQTKGAPPSLRIGGTFSPSAVLLPKLLSSMRQRYPGADLEIRTRTSDQLERLLLLSQLDLAVSAREPRSAELVCEPFQKQPIALFVLATHRLAKKATVELADLLKEPLILRGGPGGKGVMDQAVKALRDAGEDVKIAMYCDGPTAIKAAVRQKMGVGMVLADSIRSELVSGEFKTLKVPGLELVGQSYLVYSKKRPLSQIAQEFLEALRAEQERWTASKSSNRSSRSTAALRSNRSERR